MQYARKLFADRPTGKGKTAAAYDISPERNRTADGAIGYSVILIALCFLLTSTGYLAWVYNVVEIVPPGVSDAITLSAGYLFQAAGIGLFIFGMRKRQEQADRFFFAVLSLHMLCLVPAVTGHSLLPVVSFGMAANLLCGWTAGYYVYRLTDIVPPEKRASALGVGYCFSIVASWLLSLAVKKGAESYSYIVLLLCLAMTAAALYAVYRRPESPEKEDGRRPSLPKAAQQNGFLVQAGVLILLLSIVNSSGFGFPSENLQGGIHLEFSRLFYAAGLVIAGVVNDRQRKYGSMCALAAIVIPFVMLSLKNEPVSLIVFWALSYFAFGFYTVYRIILFSDLADDRDVIVLSGLGLLIGRVGDAAGEALHLLLSGRFPVLIAAAAILSVAAILLFFRVYQILYMPAAAAQRNEQEIFERFSSGHDLSGRERDVLRLLLEERTNSEIADTLFVSESTVKFHIHNILHKTGCRNRVTLLSYYSERRNKE